MHGHTALDVYHTGAARRPPSADTAGSRHGSLGSSVFRASLTARDRYKSLTPRASLGRGHVMAWALSGRTVPTGKEPPLYGRPSLLQCQIQEVPWPRVPSSQICRWSSRSRCCLMKISRNHYRPPKYFCLELIRLKNAPFNIRYRTCPDRPHHGTNV